jgi:hypothetical protein
MPYRGSQEMRGIARDLRAAGPAVRRRFRANVTAAMQPMKADTQANARAIPAKGPRSTGLRDALAAATRIQISTAGRNARVRLIVDGKKMPTGQQALPQLMEGERVWRHPDFGNRQTWVTQPSHPFVAPAVLKNLPGVDRAVDAALKETAEQLAKGGL